VNNLCFVVHAYNELELARQCVRSIRRHNPSPIIIINDGGESVGLEDLATEVGGEFIDGLNLKTPAGGGEWMRRHLQAGLDTEADFIIKLDSDAYVWKPVVVRGEEMHFFGTKSGIEWRNGYSIQGGAKGYSRSYAQRIVSLPNLDEICALCTRNTSSLWGEDNSCAVIARTLNQKAKRWADIKSQFGEYNPNTQMMKGEYSITHPVQIFNEANLIESFPNSNVWYKVRSAMSEGMSWGVKGFQISGDHKTRMDICRGCEFFNASNQTCFKCGCYMNAKTKMATAHCPINKW